MDARLPSVKLYKEIDDARKDNNDINKFNNTQNLALQNESADKTNNNITEQFNINYNNKPL